VNFNLFVLRFRNLDGDTYWIDLAQDTDRWGTFECGNEPSGYIKCRAFLV